MPLIGNKVIEKDLRDWLDANGYFGRSAGVEELELVAIRRPGWEQVFRFRVRAKRQDEDVWEDLRGLIRDDERHRTEFRLADTDEAYDTLFAEWSEGLIVLRKHPRGRIEIVLIVLGAAVVLIAGLVGLLRTL